MQNNRLHPITRFFSLLAIVVLLFPMVVKSAIILEEHHHDICIDDVADSHLHIKDLHCELYKFIAFTSFISFDSDDELIIRGSITKSIIQNYNFLHNHRSLSFSLRGPPQFS